jgi:hypothetical protein
MHFAFAAVLAFMYWSGDRPHYPANARVYCSIYLPVRRSTKWAKLCTSRLEGPLSLPCVMHRQCGAVCNTSLNA